MVLQYYHHYIKKINPPTPTPTPTPQPSNRCCCPCQVYTDKSSYQAGELVTIKVKFCQGSSYCNPSNFKVYIYMPNKVQDITYSFRKVSTGVYKSQGYAECPAGKRTIKVVKSGCNPIYAYYEVKPDKCNPKARIKIKSDYCYGYDVYVNDKFKFTENGDGYCAFDIPCNQYVTITLKKNGRTINKEFYSKCGKTYEWRITKNWCSKPDLVIDKIWWDGEPKKGDNVKIYVRVKNVGNGDAESSYTKLEVDGESLGIKYTNSLSVGETETLTFNWKADKCGDVTVKATADWYDDVDEENEYNNEKSVKLYVECRYPDLIVDSIWTDKKPKIGENFKIYVKVKNIGKKDASKFYVLIEFCGKKYTIPINYLSAGGSKTVSTNTYCNKCNTKIKVTVDYNDKVDEENEYNNYKEKSINLACPNLVVDSISYSPKSPEEGEAIKISIVVKNRGDATVPQSELKFTVDDKVEVVTIPPLDPYDSYTVTKETTLSRGKHEIWAKADYRNEITESNEFDNTKVIYIDVKRKEPKIWVKSGYTSQGVPYFDLYVDYLPGKDLKLKSDVSNKVEEPYSISGEEYVFELDGFVCNSGLCTGLLYMGDVKFTIYDGSEPIKSFTFTLDRYNQLKLKRGFYIDLSEPEMVEVNGKIYTAYPIYIDNKISKGSKLWFSPTKDKSLLKKIVLTASLQDYLKNEGVRDVLKDQLKELADKYDFILSRGFVIVKVAEFVRNTAAKLLLQNVWEVIITKELVREPVKEAMKKIMKGILEEFVDQIKEENEENSKNDKKIKELIKIASEIELMMNLRVSESYARDAIKMLDDFNKKDKEDKSWVLDYDTAWDFCNYYEKGVADGAYNYYLLYHVYLPSGEPKDQLVDVCKDLVAGYGIDIVLDRFTTNKEFKEAVDDAANFAASMLAFKRYWDDEAIDKVHSNIVNVKPAAIKVKNQYGVVTISVDLPTDKAKVKIFGYLDESFIDYRIGNVKDYNIEFGENDEYVSYTCTVNSRNAEILELEFDKSNFGNGDYPLRIEMMRVNDLDGYPILCVVEYEV